MDVKKTTAVLTTLIGALTVLAAFFSDAVVAWVSHHPQAALVLAGITKIVASFNKATPLTPAK